MPNPSNENCWLQKRRFSKGPLIVNSKLDGQNIGYPGQPNEIDWFVQMMKKAAPKMSQDDVKTIEKVLRSIAKT
jgi:hypothetical protein